MFIAIVLLCAGAAVMFHFGKFCAPQCKRYHYECERPHYECSKPHFDTLPDDYQKYIDQLEKDLESARSKIYDLHDKVGYLTTELDMRNSSLGFQCDINKKHLKEILQLKIEINDLYAQLKER